MTPEPFVTAEDVADHLKIQRRQVLEMARAKTIPGYPVCLGRSRRMWRFKLSEVDQAIASRAPHPVTAAPPPRQATMMTGSPHSQKEQSNG
jgi:excisionase family DNA binding protein